jgi:hypothetical protein
MSSLGDGKSSLGDAESSATHFMGAATVGRTAQPHPVAAAPSQPQRTTAGGDGGGGGGTGGLLSALFLSLHASVLSALSTGPAAWGWQRLAIQNARDRL